MPLGERLVLASDLRYGLIVVGATQLGSKICLDLVSRVEGCTLQNVASEADTVLLPRLRRDRCAANGGAAAAVRLIVQPRPGL
jgi:hypothetical protein